MDFFAAIALGSLIMIAGGLIGSIKSEKITIHPLPNWVRISLIIIGIMFLLLAMYIFPQSPLNPTNFTNVANHQITQTAYSNLSAQTSTTLTITPTQMSYITTTPLITATSTPENKVLSMDEIPVHINANLYYDSKHDDPILTRTANLQIFHTNTNNSYELTYSFSSKTEFDAGSNISFNFTENSTDKPLDLSTYDSIEFEIFVEPRSKMKACDIQFWDGTNLDVVQCNEDVPEGGQINIDKNRVETFVIPIKNNFPTVNLRAIRQISFGIYPFTPATGQINLRVAEIKFIK